MNKPCHFYLIFISTVCLLLSACATVQTTTAQSKADYDTVWIACIDALANVRFSASSTDKTTGLIIADQAVVGGQGTVSRLNIMVQKTATGVSVNVKYIPPPGSIGGFGIVDDYYNALTARVPDLMLSGG